MTDDTMMTRDTYRDELRQLSRVMTAVADTPFSTYAKVLALVTMNMRYETVAFNKDLPEHPYRLTAGIIRDTVTFFQTLMAIAFVESEDKRIALTKSAILEEKHEALWQEIWTRHNEKEFQEFVDLKARRLTVNGLEPYFQGKDCVEFGCGNGSFCFALLQQGASSVTGIDFGENSIHYARRIAQEKGYGEAATFQVAQVFDSRLPGNAFDFAIANGVFHHLDANNIPKALREVARVLKPGGGFWYYVDGKDAISMDLWDNSVEILKGVDVLFIEQVLTAMNIKRNKVVHLMDGLSATYIHSTWEEVTAQLSGAGFGKFRRLVGGTATDFDLDAIAADPYGREKFGEGDLRIFCQLVNK